MHYDILIRGARVVTAGVTAELAVGVEGGKIAALDPEVAGEARETIDARGLHVFPGVMDAHVHFNEPGRTDWEGVATGSAALSAGGGTCFIDMPLNSSPPTLDAPAFVAKLTAFAGTARTDFALWGGLTPDNLDRLEELAACGVAGFKAFMSGSGIEDFRRCDDESLFRGMQIAARLGLPVAVHAENDGIVSALAAAARARGRTSARDFLASRPIVAEAEAISRALLFAEETGCALHVVHTSSARGVELVRAAVDNGICDATCETCPHYLLLCDQDVQELGARAKCAPPVRSQAEREKLRALVAEGRVDTIGSDHSPSPPDMKRTDDFFRAWGGISGVQTTLRALLTLDLPLPLVARLLSENVARRFRLPGKGGIRVGADADLALVDLSTSPPLRVDELQDRHKGSPYIGQPLRGVVRRTLVRGTTVWRDGTQVGAAIGRFLRPAPVRRSRIAVDSPGGPRYTHDMAFLIREFTMADHDSACTLWRRTEGVGLSQADEPRNIARFLEKNPGQSFVAVDAGTLVGAVLCGNDGRRGFIYHLAVDRDSRRAGIGKGLVERCLSSLEAQGMRKCHIFVMAGNLEGQRFWRRIGWEERTTLIVMSHDVGPSPAAYPPANPPDTSATRTPA